MKYLVAFLVLFVSALQAQENRGVSWILQMCAEQTDCSSIDTAYKGASVLNAGWMYLTSNPNRCKCSVGFLSDPRPKRVRVDICNSTCFPERGRKCQPHECFANMKTEQANKAILSNDPATYTRIDKALSMARNDLKDAKNLVDVAVKACLECSLSQPARVKLNDYVKNHSPHPAAKFVDNPLTGSCLPGYICEKHGTPQSGSNGISDNDGKNYDAIDQWGYWKKNVNAWMGLAWKPCNNGLAKCEKEPCPFIPPQNRKNYCGSSRDGKDFQSFTTSNAIPVNSEVNPVDRKGCKQMLKPARDGFVLKLGDGRTYGVLLTPAKISQKVFKKVELLKNGKYIDGSKPQPGFRYGVPYEHDPSNAKRRIYDFRNHPNGYPDNAVLHADGYCWILPKPRFRVE